MLLLLECLIIAGIFVADAHHRIFISKTLYLLVLGWISLRVRGLSWRDVGLRGPLTARIILAGISAGVIIELLELFVTQPALVRMTGRMPDLSTLKAMHSNLELLLLGLLLTWTLVAFGEEAVYRGYMMNRLAGIFRRAPALGWVVSLVVVSAVFGYAHQDQGLTGQIENAIDGLLLGALYLLSGRNLWAPIIAHGITDTVDLSLLYLGKYPGM